MSKEEARRALVEAIRASGLSVTGFAVRRLGRDPSAVYRWLSREQDIPEVVCRWLDHNHLRSTAKSLVADMYDDILEQIEEVRSKRVGDLVRMSGGDAGYDDGYRAGVHDTLVDVAHMIEEIQND